LNHFFPERCSTVVDCTTKQSHRQLPSILPCPALFTPAKGIETPLHVQAPMIVERTLFDV
jgi:hypothetical protein